MQAMTPWQRHNIWIEMIFWHIHFSITIIVPMCNSKKAGGHITILIKFQWTMKPYTGSLETEWKHINNYWSMWNFLLWEEQRGHGTWSVLGAACDVQFNCRDAAEYISLNLLKTTEKTNNTWYKSLLLNLGKAQLQVTFLLNSISEQIKHSIFPARGSVRGKTVRYHCLMVL